MTVPPWVPQPLTPAAGEKFAAGVKVIGQVQSANNTILVTFATTALDTFTVRVPEATWLEGQHLAIGPFVFTLLQQIQAQQPDWVSHGAE